MHKVSIIMPVYNGERYIKKIVSEIRNQMVDSFVEIIAPVSKSSDNSYDLCKKYCDIAYIEENFNHALTRHNAALKATGDILVFITQDIMPCNNLWLQKLIEPLMNSTNNVAATYSRQVAYPEASLTEKLIREFNYPNYDRLCNKGTKDQWGRKNIFYSDTSSATLKEVFLRLEGYNFQADTNEDVVYAIKLISCDYSVLYNSESLVYHSHRFHMKSVYKRYKLIGRFEKMFKNELKEYSSMGEGRKMLIFLLKNLVLEFKFKELFILFVDLTVRYFAYKKGYSGS